MDMPWAKSGLQICFSGSLGVLKIGKLQKSLDFRSLEKLKDLATLGPHPYVAKMRWSSQQLPLLKHVFLTHHSPTSPCGLLFVCLFFKYYC